ncbi:MAG: hypothetical protein DME25_16225, partial [Verrucomicrobia bacterium]
RLGAGLSIPAGMDGYQIVLLLRLGLSKPIEPLLQLAIGRLPRVFVFSDYFGRWLSYFPHNSLITNKNKQ